MSAADLLGRLQALDVRLSAESGRLRVDAPRGALSAELRRELASRKQELLASLSSKFDAPIPPSADDQPSLLSFAQERLWLAQQLQPRSTAYHLCRAMRIRGELDAGALRRSMREVVRRHESFRTKFIVADGAPRQVLGRGGKTVLESFDLRQLSPARSERRARQLLEEGAARPFDLEGGELLRARLIHLRDDAHVLALFTHHIAADAWSMGILLRELWLFYESDRQGNAPSLARSACRYRDYALWQRNRLRPETIQAELGYWRKQLAGVPVLDLPTDRTRSDEPPLHGGKVDIELTESLTADLKRLSHREGATLFMTLLAAFEILLCRWSGQQDFAVGAPVAEREHRDLENVIGLFINTLALRADLSGTPSFRALLARVRETCLGAYAHQKVPFEMLARELASGRELDRTPLFQVMLVLQNTPRDHAIPAGLRVEPVEIENRAAQFDLSLYLRERAGRLIGFFEYSSELFDGESIEHLAVHFKTLLEGIIADPHCSVATLPMLSAAQRKQVLVEWNDTRAAYPSDRCIHELFEQQARKTPDRVALEDEHESLTYREINVYANRLARELMKLGVGAEHRVALLAERSAQTIAAALAIFKAGGVYVPLDPSYPKERLAFMLADSGAAVLLSEEKFARWYATSNRPTLRLEPRWRASGDAPNISLKVPAESAAYILYTSGSTGMPKGVIAPHRAALNRFAWMWRAYPFGEKEKIAQKTSLSFVDSIWEMFGGLLRGVPTAIISDPAAKDPGALADYLADCGATRLVSVPSVLRELLDQSDVERRLSVLRYCFSSGEALPTDLAARFRALLPDCRLINLYGSSEVAGDVTSYQVDGSERGSAIPIGRPIANSGVYLLDHDLAPVPLGARGEIYIAGDNLAVGYVDAELTTEKFIADPFSGAANARLYRTGDLGRYRTDGNLEFLGRKDRQLKIRGVRVEPGEIESALAAHPAVRACLVALQSREIASDDPKSKIQNPKLYDVLTAYIASNGTRPTPPALRAFLKARLPDSMIPSVFVFLDALPRLPNGKIDASALRRISTKPIREAPHAPRNDLEKSIAAIWAEVLAVERLGINDDFFQLGGHSLSAAKVAAKLRDAVNRPISMRDLFDAPTIAGLAKAIEAMAQQDVPPIRPVMRSRNLPLSAGQVPLFVMSQLFGGGDFLNLPYAYRLEGRLDEAALRRSIQELIQRHAVLRTVFQDMGSGAKQFIRRSCAVRMPVIDLALPTRAQKDLAMEEISKLDAAQTFDIEQPPLARFKLLRLGEIEHILLVTLHHLVGDQWSMGVLHRELAALYQAFSQGKSSPLAELPIQFADFACWQKETLENGGFATQIAYWLKQLRVPAPRLEFRRADKKPPRYRSGRLAVEIADALFARIKAFARERNCTPFMIFAAALHVLLHRYTGNTDIRIGTLVANRGRPQTDGLIGYFVNALVLRAQIHSEMTFAALVDQVRETCVTAYANQDLPFEHLETLLDKHTRRPLYQVMLNYRKQSTPTLEANGLRIASWGGKYRAADPGIGISRLDVNFQLRELPTKVTGVVHFKSELFDEARIGRFVSNYARILERMVNSPGARVTVPKIFWG